MLDVPELAATRWSVEVVDSDGRTLAGRDETVLLPTASLAKVFLLAEVAERIVAGELDAAELLDRRSGARVGDSGLWQHLSVETLPATDLAMLVGSVSDNLATNVLLDRVGLDAVQHRAAVEAPGGSMLHDRVRDVRRAGDPPMLSVGCARDYAQWFRGLASARPAHRLVRGWLSAGTDLSMVAGAFDLDPLAHTGLWHKTGTDVGVRADAGTVTWQGRTASYAALCAWDPDAPASEILVTPVLAAMRGLGAVIRAELAG